MKGRDGLHFGFFIEKEIDKDAMMPIANKAEERGHNTTFNRDYSTEVDIGFYCHTRYDRNTESELSVRMFHGIDDAYREDYWPKGWEQFDVGLLPGRAAANRWKEKSCYPEANPKIGIFEVGWPKSDFVQSETFHNKVNDYKAKHELESERTILYAPTSEDHGKMHEFVDYCEDLSDTLLIKHAPYEELKFNNKYDSLDSLYDEYKLCDNIHIFDISQDIWLCLAIADIVVSEQSSVLNEAILTNTIPVSITDWPIRSGSSNKIHHTDFVLKIESNELGDTLRDIYYSYDDYLHKTQQYRENHYSFLGKSASITVELVESLFNNKRPLLQPIEPKESLPIYHKYYTARNFMLNNSPNRLIQILSVLGIGRFETLFRKKTREYIYKIK